MSTITKLHPHVNITTNVIEKPTITVNNTGTALYAVFESDKGLDNKIQKINTVEEFINKYGDFNPKKYGQTHLNIYQWLSSGGSVYANRLLPQDSAKHAHAFLNLHIKDETLLNPELIGAPRRIDIIRPVISYNGQVNNNESSLLKELENKQGVRTKDNYFIYPLFVAYSKARGSYYNKIGFRLELNRKEMLYDFPVYNFTVLEEQRGIMRVIEGPFLVSLNPDALRYDGISMFIEDVINNNSEYISIKFNVNALDEIIAISQNNETPLTYNSDFIFGTTEDSSLIKFVLDTEDTEAISLDGLSFESEEVVSAIESSLAQLRSFSMSIPNSGVKIQINDGIIRIDNTDDGRDNFKISDILFTRQMITADKMAQSYSSPNHQRWELISNKFYPITVTETRLSGSPTVSYIYRIATPESILNDYRAKIDHARDFELAHRIAEQYLNNNGIDYRNTKISYQNIIDEHVNYWKQLYRNALNAKNYWETIYQKIISDMNELEKLKTNTHLSKDSRLETLQELYESLLNNEKIISDLFKSYDDPYLGDENSKFKFSLQRYKNLKFAKDRYGNTIRLGYITVEYTEGGQTIKKFEDVNDVEQYIQNCINASIHIDESVFNYALAEAIDILYRVNKQLALIIKPTEEYTQTILNNINRNQVREQHLVNGSNLMIAGILVEEMFKDFALKEIPGFENDDDIGGTIDIVMTRQEYNEIINILEEEKIKSYQSLSETNRLANNDIIMLMKGSNGEINNDTVRFKMYYDAFNGDIVKESEYPVNVILDAGYHPTIKKYIIDLVDNKRTDIMAFMDCGIGLTSAKDVITYVEQYYSGVNTENIAIYGQHLIIYDIFSRKDIAVTPTYALASLIPRNDNTNGIHTTLSGLRRGIITNIKDISFNPSDDEQEELYLARINYIEKTRNAFKIETQQTFRKSNDALNKINNTRVIKRIRVDVKEICEPFISEFNDRQTLINLQKRINNYLQTWKNNRACEIAEAVVSSDETAKAMGIVRVKVTLKFTGTIDIIDVEFEVQ